MRTIQILAVSQNQITISPGANIGESDCVSFDERHFFQVRKIQDSNYLVHGDVPQDATLLRVGRTASTDNGVRFLTPAEERQISADEQRERQQPPIQVVESAYFLFEVLTDQELTAILTSTDIVVEKGLLRMALIPRITSTDQWFKGFIKKLTDLSILSQARGTDLLRFGAVTPPTSADVP